MHNIDWSIFINIAKPVVLLFIGAGLTHFLERRARVITYLRHVSGINLSRTEGPITINSHTIVLRNNGRKVANDIRLGHVILPDFQIYPPVEYTVRDLSGGQKEIVIPKLIPKKEISITYLYMPPITWNQVNSHYDSDDGPIQVVKVLPTVQMSRWAVRLFWCLAIYGAIALSYTLWVLTVTLYAK